MSLLCLLRHSWKAARDTGKTTYEECRRCPARRVRQRPGGYQPVDRVWLRSARLRTKGEVPSES